MSALQSIVRRHAVKPSHAGSGAQEFDREALQRELARLRGSREVAFWLMFGLFVVLVVAMLVVAVSFRDDPTKLKQLSAATGLTIMGVMAAIVRLWQTKVAADLVIAIVSGTSEDAARAVLNTLVARL